MERFAILHMNAIGLAVRERIRMSEFPHKIEQCVWELTLRCNMRCLHCGPSAGQARQGEFAVMECMRVAEQLIEQGCRQVTLVGGEVFLYDGWENIARLLSDGGVSVNIVTNGFLSGRRQVAQLHRARPTTVGVCIDGMQASHNRVRRVPGSFTRAVNLLGLLVREGFSVGVVTNLLDFNVGDLPDMYDMLVGEGVKAWQIRPAPPVGNLSVSRHLRLRPTRVSEITRFIAQKRAAGRIDICAGDDTGYFGRHEPLLRCEHGTATSWQSCPAGLRSVGIDSAGNVRGCPSLADDRFIEGNLRTQTLVEIWRRPGAFAYNRRFHKGLLEGQCSDCDKGDICRAGCRSMCFSTTGRLYDNPYCCYRPAAPVRLVARKRRAKPHPNRAQTRTINPASAKPHA